MWARFSLIVGPAVSESLQESLDLFEQVSTNLKVGVASGRRFNDERVERARWGCRTDRPTQSAIHQAR